MTDEAKQGSRCPKCKSPLKSEHWCKDDLIHQGPHKVSTEMCEVCDDPWHEAESPVAPDTCRAEVYRGEQDRSDKGTPGVPVRKVSCSSCGEEYAPGVECDLCAVESPVAPTMAQVCPGEDARECGEAVAPTPFGWWDTFNEHLYRNEADAARAIEGGNHVIALFVQAAQTSLHTEERGEFEKWFAESRELNPNCGCEQRGNRLFQCKYHEGAEDGWLARSRKG